MKLVHALRVADPVAARDALLDRGLHAALADVGVQRLQVNVDDDAIDEAALRLQAFGAEPVRVVVSTWTDGAADDVTDVVRQVVALGDPEPAGWEVEERVPTAPPPAPDGERADALANVAFLRRPAEMAADAWLAHWHGPHTQVAIETQATFGYVQNVVRRSLTAGTPRVDGIVEELFPSAAGHDVHAFYGSGGDDAELARRLDRLMASVAAFGADRDLDLVPTSRYVVTLA